MPQFGFGSGRMYAVRTDVALATPVLFGVMQDITIDFAGEIKDLFGQYQYPVDSARGKTKIDGKSKVGILSPLLFNTVFFGQTTQTGEMLSTATGEVATIGAAITGTTSGTTASGNPTLHFTSTPTGVVVGASIVDTTAGSVIPSGTYVLASDATTVTMSANATGAGVGSGDTITFGPSVTSANAATFSQDLGVISGVTGVPLVKVAGSPTTGQYTVTSGGVYSFASADATKGVLLNYLYGSASTGTTIIINNALMGTTPRFLGVFTSVYENKTVTLELYQCVAQKLTMPTKIDDYMIQELDFSAFANATGNVGRWSMTDLG